MAAIAIASLLVHIYVGVALRHLTEEPVVVVGGGIAMLTLLCLAIAGRNPAALGLAMLAIHVLLTTNMYLPAQDQWVFWFAGGLCGFCGALAYRGNVGWSAAIVAMSWLGVAVTLTLRSDRPPGLQIVELVGFYAGPLAATIFGIVGWIINASRAALRLQATERESALVEADALSLSAKQWLEDHGALIRRVTPVLEQLARAAQATPLLMQDCYVMEAECRDHLELPALVTPQVAVELEQARRRGATIKLSAPLVAQQSEATLDIQRQLLLAALSVQSLRALVLTPDTDGTSLLLRADQDITLDHLGAIAQIAETVPLLDGILIRFRTSPATQPPD